MIPFPDIDPVIVQVGPLAIRWYGVMYIAGFVISYLLVRYQIKKKGLNFNSDFIMSLYLYLIVGLMIGARLGFVIFYGLPHFIHHPLEIFAIWFGGMSIHGGLIGSVFAGYLFCRRYKVDFWQMSDLVVATAPIGIGLGRIGNFINGELFGRITDLPWGIIFPAGGPFPRHPSQLYQFALEGVALFIILWILKDKGLKSGVLLSFFIIFYGVFRFFAEFFREPDPHLGFILGPFTMGQLLSAAMIIVGAGILYMRGGVKQNMREYEK
ncbi:prolipoprotein diacylglyceryl transferase [Thermodesulfovibrionales bacterium]|nr:prolipoprotein diacylglyceryl transferase [Thermodesulfovibrionales bacterium]MCL0042117.1 prolipoprotein diacylglyceryl transferase [Thermodesulfovibrionales bacterium]MCL0086203.1 prolipoprotein diacylglyceryl transferase [Thermodesulfovibrionales bacterium]